MPGEDGKPGETGNPGDDGLPGEEGPAGMKGDKGDKGMTGDSSGGNRNWIKIKWIDFMAWFLFVCIVVFLHSPSVLLFF